MAGVRVRVRLRVKVRVRVGACGRQLVELRLVRAAAVHKFPYNAHV